MNHNKRGFTLIETLIYIALVTLIMGSGVVAAFYIIDSSEKSKTNIATVAEADFLLRKIDWALTGATSIDTSLPETLSVTKTGFPTISIYRNVSSNRAEIAVGSATSTLTENGIRVTGLMFTYFPPVPPKPAGVTASTAINGSNFQMTKYLRK